MGDNGVPFLIKFGFVTLFLTLMIIILSIVVPVFIGISSP